MPQCKTCNHFYWETNHICAPKWECIVGWDAENDSWEFPNITYAHHHDEAAEIAAKQYNEGGDTIVNDPIMVKVRKEEGASIWVYEVIPEYIIEYTAFLKENE